MISFATGPSRTADIEKTLVVGVHGPKEVFCFLIDNPLEL
jgi:L-lactate dehydrogenase complex protein LldG